MARNIRIPKRVAFPFGYTVTIELVPPSNENLLAESGYADGIWDPETRKIYINKKLSAYRRRRLVIHELAHALNDCQHHLVDTGVIGD